jgi:hypothetical protein
MTVREIIEAFGKLPPDEQEQVRALIHSGTEPHIHPPVKSADFETAMKTADEILSKHAKLLKDDAE